MIYAKGYLFRIPSNKWSSKKTGSGSHANQLNLNSSALPMNLDYNVFRKTCFLAIFSILVLINVYLTRSLFSISVSNGTTFVIFPDRRINV